MATGDELRAVMRRHPVGVCVVTVQLARERVGAQRLGVTVASLVSVALEPPLVSISIAHQAALHELLREAGGYGVSLLRADQQPLAEHFARGVPPIAMWTGIDVREGTRGPLLEGSLGWLQCAVVAEHEAGDHTLFLGLVEHAEEGEPGPALVRHGGRYAAA